MTHVSVVSASDRIMAFVTMHNIRLAIIGPYNAIYDDGCSCNPSIGQNDAFCNDVCIVGSLSTGQHDTF